MNDFNGHRVALRLLHGRRPPFLDLAGVPFGWVINYCVPIVGFWDKVRLEVIPLMPVKMWIFSTPAVFEMQKCIELYGERVLMVVYLDPEKKSLDSYERYSRGFVLLDDLDGKPEDLSAEAATLEERGFQQLAAMKRLAALMLKGLD